MKKLTQKEISDIVYGACRNWDVNWMTRQFADEVAKEIKKQEKLKNDRK